MIRNLILLGDSIFDNGPYIDPRQADATTHLMRKLPPSDWTLDMRAVDGAIVGDVEHNDNRQAYHRLSALGL